MSPTNDWPKNVTADVRVETVQGKETPVVYVAGAKADRLRIAGAGKVEWTCAIGPFAVLMKDDSPFEGDEQAAGGKNGKNKPTKIKADCGSDDGVEYSYAIVVIKNGQVLSTDPDIVVGPTR